MKYIVSYAFCIKFKVNKINDNIGCNTTCQLFFSQIERA